MAEKKRIFVLVFAVLLSLMPLGIYWYYYDTGGEWYDISIPYYLFRTGTDRTFEGIGGSMLHVNGELARGQLWHMQVLGYLYVIATVAVLIEYVYQEVKKKDMKELLDYTTKIHVIIATVLFAVSLIHFRRYFPKVDSSYWSSGISFIQMMIARGIRVSLYGDARYKPRDSRKNVWRNLLYFGLFILTFCTPAFRHVLTMNHEGQGLEWNAHNVYFVTMENWSNYWEVYVMVIAALLIILLIAAVGLVTKKEEIRIHTLARIEKIADWLTTLFLIWIVMAGLFAPQMQDPTWYFAPGLVYSTFISWGCWRLSGASDKLVW